MTLDYADHKLSEALRLANGNAAKARRQIQAWFYEDPKLLMELTRPHWNGIVAYAVDRAISREKRGETPAKAKKVSAKSKKAEGPIGKEMLRSFVSDHAAKFGHESSSGAPMPSRKAASQDHVDALHLIAAKSKQKSKKDR